MLGITRRDRKRASWIKKQTKVQDIPMTINSNKWAWLDFMRSAGNRWTARITEWEPRKGKVRQRRTRWGD